MTRAIFVAAAAACTYPILSDALNSPIRHVDHAPRNKNDLPDFTSFHATHDRNYVLGSSEYIMREKLYKQSAEKVREQNSKPNRRWTAGINLFADQTEEEFASRLGWRHQPGAHRSAKRTSLLEHRHAPLPANVSWTHLSMATAMPDQGSCGSCWAMATVTTLSAHSEINFGKPTHFSAQELVDCVQNPLNCGGKGGCDGATVELAMDWAVFRGLESLSAAPTTKGGEGTCMKSLFRAKKEEQGTLDADGRLVSMAPVKEQTLVEAKHTQSIGLAGYTTLPSNQYKPLLTAVLSGPVAVSVDASLWSSYMGGIFDDCGGSLATINHAVVLFGYGTTSKGMYWHIRNSWGGFWGEDGYIKLIRTDDEESQCADDKDPKMGVSCESKETPSFVRVCGHCGILYDSVTPNFAGGNPKVTYSTDANGRVAPDAAASPSENIFSAAWTRMR